MIKVSIPMTLDYFNDFYYLEALKADISIRATVDPSVGFRPAVERLAFDVNRTIEELVPNIALRTFLYLYSACLGELRHAAETLAKDSYIEQLMGGERKTVFEEVAKYKPDIENINAIIKGFSQDWRGSFGGDKWRDIAKCLKMYFDDSNSSFIDHVVDLQHNCGTVFSKSETRYSIKFKTEYTGDFTNFLNYKFRKNILKQSFLHDMKVTRKTRNLLSRYEVVFREKPINWVKAGLETLDLPQIEWGNGRLTTVKKWLSWADCTKGNTPSIKWLLYTAGIEDLGIYQITRKDFKSKIEEIKDKVKRKIVEYGNTYDAELEALTKRYYRNNKRGCMAEKQEVTYTILPIKYKTSGDYLVIQFSIPFFGVGKETEYGFELKCRSQGIHLVGKEAGLDGTEGFEDGLMESKINYLKIYSRVHSWTLKNNKLMSVFQ